MIRWNKFQEKWYARPVLGAFSFAVFVMIGKGCMGPAQAEEWRIRPYPWDRPMKQESYIIERDGRSAGRLERDMWPNVHGDYDWRIIERSPGSLRRREYDHRGYMW